MEFQFRTFLFLGLLTALLVGVGLFLGGIDGAIIGLVFAGVMNFVSYFFSDKIVLAMYRAKKVDPKTEQGSRITRLVQHVASRMSIPIPDLYTIGERSPNAFATGRGPGHAAIVFTEGILSLLDDSELEGVIAHELSHVKNRDVLISSIAATIAGAIGILSHVLLWGGSSREDGKGNIIGMILLAISIPIIATLIQLAISRSREYLADETAAHTLHSGQGLANALRKLEKGITHRPFTDANSGTAHMFIANPFSSEGIVGLFHSHPPINERIERLKKF
ncbi:MAG: zinc metalloprotease HtpX [archaeon]